nr:BTB/POZ domain-containing protein 1-like [Procambarus clarkii]
MAPVAHETPTGTDVRRCAAPISLLTLETCRRKMMGSEAPRTQYFSQRTPVKEPINVIERIKSLYMTGKCSDLTIRFSGRKETIQAHRLILAMSSPVFEAELYGHKAVGTELTLTDSVEAFQWLMEYMYSDRVHFPTTPMALEVSHLASKYEMTVLKYICSEYLSNALNDANYLMVYNAAVQMNISDLINKCSQIMEGSSSSVFCKQHITQLSRWALKHLLEQPHALVNEVTVFSSLITWAQHQLELRGTNCTPSDLRQEMNDFLPLVRFLTMTTDEFVENVVPTEVFTLEETCAILRNMKHIEGVPLPRVCSTSRERRDKRANFQ